MRKFMFCKWRVLVWNWVAKNKPLHNSPVNDFYTFRGKYICISVLMLQIDNEDIVQEVTTIFHTRKNYLLVSVELQPL